jgi:tRNA pseudouridine55 synthase
MCLIIIIHKKNKPKELYQVHLGSFANGFFEIPADCSKGTYIRALARDLGEALGSGAFLHSLRRTKNGGFSVEEALGIDDLSQIFAI